MVAFSSHKRQKGSGIFDSIMNQFTYQKYSPERHAISQAPLTKGVPMNFMGPYTRLDLRLNPDGTPKPDSMPINHADYASYKHDLAYDKANKS